ncbi:MAG: DUF167 domain-containing protein [Candidatus Aminicenantes bacterium]|nr:DUF167 domain-containing protein [Candidatus Aminicenantes bacterium]
MELRLRVKVQPRAKKRGVDWTAPCECRVRVTAPPVEGRANKEVLAALAEDLGLPVARFSLRLGEKSNHKVVALAVAESELPALYRKRPDLAKGVRP